MFAKLAAEEQIDLFFSRCVSVSREQKGLLLYNCHRRLMEREAVNIRSYSAKLILLTVKSAYRVATLAWFNDAEPFKKSVRDESQESLG